jgi:hypothetical protein
MANMSYCRFQNTLSDLRDCQRAMEDGAADNAELGTEERRARDRLIVMCRDIADEFEGIAFGEEEPVPPTEPDPSIDAAKSDLSVLEAYAASKVQS